MCDIFCFFVFLFFFLIFETAKVQEQSTPVKWSGKEFQYPIFPAYKDKNFIKISMED